MGLLDFLCCCGCRKQPDEESQIDENTHLIPQAPDYDLYDESLLNQRRLDERLGTIIRSKEGKMVNVSSHFPFNLHNRALPEESFSNSRSASRSVDMYYIQGKEDNQYPRPRGRRWPSNERYPTGEHPYERRPSSQDSNYREALRREPLFNVKIVGYESPNRGRSARPDVALVPDAEQPFDGTVGAVSSDGSAALPHESHEVQFKDIELLCTSWDS